MSSPPPSRPPGAAAAPHRRDAPLVPAAESVRERRAEPRERRRRGRARLQMSSARENTSAASEYDASSSLPSATSGAMYRCEPVRGAPRRAAPGRPRALPGRRGRGHRRFRAAHERPGEAKVEQHWRARAPPAVRRSLRSTTLAGLGRGGARRRAPSSASPRALTERVKRPIAIASRWLSSSAPAIESRPSSIVSTGDVGGSRRRRRRPAAAQPAGRRFAHPDLTGERLGRDGGRPSTHARRARGSVAPAVTRRRRVAAQQTGARPRRPRPRAARRASASAPALAPTSSTTSCAPSSSVLVSVFASAEPELSREVGRLDRARLGPPFDGDARRVPADREQRVGRRGRRHRRRLIVVFGRVVVIVLVLRRRRAQTRRASRSASSACSPPSPSRSEGETRGATPRHRARRTRRGSPRPRPNPPPRASRAGARRAGARRVARVARDSRARERGRRRQREDEPARGPIGRLFERRRPRPRHAGARRAVDGKHAITGPAFAASSALAVGSSCLMHGASSPGLSPWPPRGRRRARRALSRLLCRRQRPRARWSRRLARAPAAAAGAASGHQLRSQAAAAAAALQPSLEARRRRRRPRAPRTTAARGRPCTRSRAPRTSLATAPRRHELGPLRRRDRGGLSVSVVGRRRRRAHARRGRERYTSAMRPTR